MNDEVENWRLRLARELSKRAKASPTESLATPINLESRVPRTGMTGPPGAGKSSLVARLAASWIAGGLKVGALAIDPTSPLSGGAVLGDRVRMDEVADTENFYVRSLSSGTATNGLCPNLLSLLDAMDSAGFDEVILETVGVGQVSYEASVLVDTFVLVLVPGSGDTVQAMKAGVLETADIYVINKADLPGAGKLASELRSIAKWRGRSSGTLPEIIETSAVDGHGIEELSAAIRRHRGALANAEQTRKKILERRAHHLKSLLLQGVEEAFARDTSLLQEGDPRDAYERLLGRLASWLKR